MGDWLFAPSVHGDDADENLIIEYRYDHAGRQMKVIDPVGNEIETAYRKDGQIVMVTDAEDMDTVYHYDQLRRRIRIVQGFADNGEDPKDWVWDDTDIRWEESDGTPIAHGTENDQNIIVDVVYDKGGRTLSLRNPRGDLTEYAYDKLNRRISLTNPLSQSWETAYSDLTTGGTQVAMTYPGLTSGGSYTVQRTFDRLGRLHSIAYGSPTTTPDVVFGYDAAGNRMQMTEYGGTGFTNRVRELFYDYDAARRLVQVSADGDGNGVIDTVVDYEYDAGGLRTKLTLPGNLEVTYTYDAKGQLVSLTDWDSQATTFTHDAVGRLLTQERPNGLDSSYTYDPAGRLRLLRHVEGTTVYGEFAYEVDGRGNRTQAHETVLHPGGMDSDEYTLQYSYDALSRLTHADFYIGTDLNVSPEWAYTYSYDQAGNRLNEGRALNGGTPTDTSYSYNAANQLTSDGSNTFGYDANGNLTTVNSFPIATWDRANRMLSGSDGTTNVQYTYAGTGERVRKVVGGTTYNYLVDVQSPLPVVLTEYVGSSIRQFVHGPRGVYAQEDASGNWTWPLQDGLGSVRLVSDDSPGMVGIQHYKAYGIPYGTQGSMGLPYGFTGEQTDENGLVYLRARYYSPPLGIFTALDPFEGNAISGAVGELIFHNRYSYANSNPVNLADPSGLIPISAEALNNGTCLLLPISPTPPNYGWECIGSNCQQWLEDAYNTLVNHNDPVLQMLGTLLDEVGRRNSIPTAFHFNLPPRSGAVTYSGRLVGLDSGYLSDRIASNGEIAVLLHELWHTQQQVNDRLTVWGEVDAYNLETVIMRALGMTIPAWRASLEQYGTPGMITRDVCSMCQARECLLHATNNHWLYSAEPVVNAPWLFPWLDVGYLPADCPRICPNVVPLTCT